VKLIARFARKVVVNYDGDRAGVQAAKRAIETLLTEDLEVKVLVLPDNADPDDFIRKYGVDEYQQRRGKAQPHIQFVIDQAVRDRNLRNPPDKQVAVEEVLPYIRAVRSRIQRREYFDIAMDSLRIQPDQRREIWQRVRVGASGDVAAVQEIITRAPAAEPTDVEERLLQLLFEDEELRRVILPRLEEDDYRDLVTAPIFRALIELHDQNAEIDSASLTEAVVDNATASELLARLLTLKRWDFEEDALAAAERCVHDLRRLELDRCIDELNAEMAQADRSGENEKRDRLAMEVLELTKKRNALLPQVPAAH